MGEGSPEREVELSAAERADIDGMYLRLATTTHYELLGVSTASERKEIRDAYFALSQRFHPDAYFGRQIGAWKPRVEAIFREVTRAYDVLSNRRQRAEYDAQLAARGQTPSAPAAPRAAAELAPAPPASAPMPPAQARSEVSPTAPTVLMAAVTPPALPPRAPAEAVRRATPPPALPPKPNPVDPEAARRAAREVLARKMGAALPERGGSGAPRSTPFGTQRLPERGAPATPRSTPFGTQRLPERTDPAPRRTTPGTTSRLPERGDGAAPPRSTPLGTQRLPERGAQPALPRSTPLQSLEAGRAARAEAERITRVGNLVREADAALERNDLVAASNALQVAAGLAPEDAKLATRAEETARRLAESMVERYVEQARQQERAGHYAQAAESWHRAWIGRSTDTSLLLRGAHALLRGNTDLPRAAEWARRACQLSPRSLESQVLLAQIFLAGGMRASALAALESAQRLDPASPVVKDLSKQLKG